MSEASRSQPKRRRGMIVAIAVAALAIALVAVGVDDRAKSMQEAGRWSDTQAVQSVRLVVPKAGPATDDLELPGTVRAFTAGALYARASGYVTAWHKDIGARVKKGDILADISAPDLDQQLAQGKAQLIQLQAAVDQAQANADLGKAVNLRTAQLVKQGWSSELKGDTDRYGAASTTAAVAVAKANIATQQAAVQRLEELASFEKITAPFDGVVTQRNVDVGDLVTANGTAGKPLFQVSDIHRVRIYVDVPQAFLGGMKAGVKATLTIPGKTDTFGAAISSTANALGEGSRTALVELQADNAGDKLWPGAFAEVSFHIPAQPGTLVLPATALVFGRSGMEVAAVGKDRVVTLRPVTVGRNLGNDIEIVKGLHPDDELIDNPLETTVSGEKVRVGDKR